MRGVKVEGRKAKADARHLSLLAWADAVIAVAPAEVIRSARERFERIARGLPEPVVGALMANSSPFVGAAAAAPRWDEQKFQREEQVRVAESFRDEIGRRAATARRAAGYSSRESFARHSGISENSIERIETGAETSRSRSYARIASALGVSLEWLMAGKGGR